MSVRAAALLGCAVAASASLASAAELHLLEVTREGGRYELVAETHLQAPIENVFAVLVDYEDGGLGRISSVYKQSDYLEPAADGTPVVYTRMEGCVLFFCKSLERVERLEAEEPHYIRTEGLPERSDFEFSRSEWILKPVAEGTEVTYRLEIEPGFWVPPVIGPLILKRELKVGGERALYRIEKLARGEETEYPRSQGVDPELAMAD